MPTDRTAPGSEPVVVITGASSGIGLALAELLSARGARIGMIARREAVLTAAARELGPGAFPIVADITDRQAVRRAVRAAVSHFGRIDVWVNNVGRGITRKASELTDEDIESMMRLNVLTALYGTQEVLPHFLERGRGIVINVSSLLGRIPYVPFRSAYAGAKHFLNALTAAFRDEFRQSHPDIRFCLVSPGVVRTDFGRNALHGGPDSRKLPDSQEPEEVAAIIAGLIENPRDDVYTRPGIHDRIVGYYQSVGTDP